MTKETHYDRQMRSSTHRNESEQNTQSTASASSEGALLTQAVQRRCLRADLSEVSHSEARSISNTKLGKMIARFDRLGQEYRLSFSLTQGKS